MSEVAEHGHYKQKNVISRMVGNELILYDERTHIAHCLNEVACEIWFGCEQHRSAAQVLDQVRLRWPGIGEDSVTVAFDELIAVGLLEPTTDPGSVLLSRRQAVRRIMTAAAAVPVITSMLVPTAAAAQSLKTGSSRTGQHTRTGKTGH